MKHLDLKKTNVQLKENHFLATDIKTHENQGLPINEALKYILKGRIKKVNSDYVFFVIKRDKGLGHS